MEGRVERGRRHHRIQRPGVRGFGSPRPSRFRRTCSPSWPGSFPWRPQPGTGASSGCFTARRMPPRSHAIARRFSTCTPPRSAGSKTTRRFRIRSASSMSSRFPPFSSVAWSTPEPSSTTPPSLLLDESATQNQMLDRASVISHETAHMWFGDLVTMRWFNDVWMKEVFANFMAGKIVNPSFPQVNHDLRFLLANYPGAYQVDRTAGTNAIRQPLANLDDAGQLYGADHLPEGADRHAATGDDCRRDGVPRRPSRVPRDLLVRKCDVARSRAHPGCTHQRRSRRVEPRLGGGARPSRGPHGRAG